MGRRGFSDSFLCTCNSANTWLINSICIRVSSFIQDKNEQKQPAAEQAAPVEEVKTEQTAAPAEEQTTFTVTKEQMEKMEGLAKLVSDVNDKYLRLAAEYDNYRKRTTREKENAYADAKADTIKPFLDVLDNLERGTQQFEEGDP